MKKPILLFYSLIMAHVSPGQLLTLTTTDNTSIEVKIIPRQEKHRLLQDLNGRKDDSLRKEWTSRTYHLSDGRLLVEFYDRQAAVFRNKADFQKIKEVRFCKNYIDFLKKNITYKIEISFEQGKDFARSALRRPEFKPGMEYWNYEVYERQNGQILFLYKTAKDSFAVICPDFKGLCSDNSEMLDQYYKGMEAWTEKLLKGDPLPDYDIDGHLVYPKDLSRLIGEHQLSLAETNIYVSNFFGNLYRSAKGYYILIDEVNQKNGAGDIMPILTARVYWSLEEVRKAQKKYLDNEKRGYHSEHFYEKISSKYGKDFPRHTGALIDSLPGILNLDKEQLTFDSAGMAIVDEAIRWIHDDYSYFNTWFPAVLAYYGKCYMILRGDGRWTVSKEKKEDVWVPQLILANKEIAFDVYDFYKDLLEWPQSIKEAGDWDGWRKDMRKKMKITNNRP